MNNGLKRGDRVIITSKTSKYKGLYATVEFVAGGKVAVYPDGVDIYHPPRSEGDYNKTLKLMVESVKRVSEYAKENNMAKLTGFKKVVVIKMSTGDYHYALYDETISEGDKVLVTGANKCVQIVKEIITVDEAEQRFRGNICEEVICKVDMSDYEKRVNCRTKAAELKQKMDAEIKKMQEVNKYEIYAKENPELAEMLETYKTLVC